MSETWKPVVGHELDYEVSDLGRVRSRDRVKRYTRTDQYSGRDLTIERSHRGRMLRPGRMKSGRLSVVLGRKTGSCLVHHLVLEAFVGPCPQGQEGCHRDDIPSNNKLGNLRWGTRSDNMHDAVRNGGRAVGERATGAKLKDADIPAIRAAIRGRGDVARLARQHGVNETTIRQVRDGTTWRHIPCS